MRRMMNRNKSVIYYALFDRIEIIRNDDSHEIGRVNVYHKPVRASAHVSVARGESEAAVFGVNLQYDKSLIYGKGMLPIMETSVLWVDRVPLLNEDGTLVLKANGSPETPHDYTVTLIALGLNYTSVAITRVNTS